MCVRGGYTDYNSANDPMIGGHQTHPNIVQQTELYKALKGKWSVITSLKNIVDGFITQEPKLFSLSLIETVVSLLEHFTDRKTNQLNRGE